MKRRRLGNGMPGWGSRDGLGAAGVGLQRAGGFRGAGSHAWQQIGSSF